MKVRPVLLLPPGAVFRREAGLTSACKQCVPSVHSTSTTIPYTLQEQNKSATDCAATRPEECESLRYALFACRRGQVDARSRIQGNKGY